MFSLFLSPSKHDLMITSKGKIQKISGAQEVRQRVIVTLRHQWEEYFLNVISGIPWYALLLGTKDLVLVENWVRQTILDVPGVISIIDITVMYSTSEKNKVLLNSDIEVYGTKGTDIIALENEVLGGA